jgi:hypothetical protein
MKKFILSLLVWGLSNDALANYSVRLGQSFSTSSALWVGETKRDYRGADLVGNGTKATRHYYQTDLDVRKTFSNGTYLSGGLVYSYSKTFDAPILQTVAGESHSQLTRITVKAGHNFNIANFTISPFIGYEHPGKMAIKQPVFLSPHDYSTNFLAGFSVVKIFQKIISSFYFANRHVIKGKQPEQMVFQAQGLYRFSNKLSFGLGVDVFHAQGGMDINSTRFSTITQSTGILPVWRKKERYKGYSLIGNYRFSNKLSLDSFLHRKFDGRNTDDGTTFGVAGSWNF